MKSSTAALVSLGAALERLIEANQIMEERLSELEGIVAHLKAAHEREEINITPGGEGQTL